MKYRSVRPVLMGLLFWIAGRVALADDLYLTWVKSSSPTSQTLRSVVFGNGIFVAVGDGGILLASQDGVSWGLREVGVTNDLRDITFGNGRFVAMGDAIVTSTDASVWTARSAALPLFGAAYGNGTFSGVGTGDPSAHGFSCNVCGILGGQNECPGDAQGTEFIVASDDGYSWRSLTNTTDFEALRDVIYGNGRFIAVGTRFFYYQLDWGTHDGFYSWYYLCHISPVFKGSSWTSTDGYSWTRSADASKWLRSIAFGGNNFVAVGAAGLIQTTIDAGSWDTISSGSGADLNGVGYGGGAFLAVGDGGALLVSGDGGSTWSARQTGTSSNLFGVAYGKGIAVAVGAGGTILCSGSALPTASIAGKVTGNRLPLVGAQVRVEGTAYAASTDINGDFTIVGVPVSSGYVLLASACGYGSARRPGIVVNQGDNSIPDFDLQVVNGPYQLIALVPDVNPKTNTIEEGGTAYRYYCLIAADGHTPVSCGTVSVRVAGGSDIPQLGDASDTWVGRTAGVPDADGVVRLRIPASAIGPVNTCQTLQVLESGVGIPNLSFQACVVPRQYEQVWKHKFGGGVSFKGEGVRVGVEGAYESAIRRHILGSAVDWEEIKRSRSVEGRAGVEVGTGVRLGAVAVGAKTGAGGFIEGEASTTYDLPYGSTDPGVNAMKLYVAAGDPLSLCAGPAKGLVDLVRAKYEQWYMKDNLKDASGGLTIGGYTEADASVGFGLGQAGDVKIGASGSAEVAAFSQYTIEYKDQGRPAQGEPVSRSIGMSSSAKSSFNLGLCSPNPTKGGLGFQFFVGADSSYKSIVTKRSDLDYYHEIAVEQACQLNYGVTVKALPGFGDSYDPDVTPSADFRREFTETVMLNFTDAGGFGELASREPFWGAVSSGSFGIMLPDLNARMLQSLFDTSVSRGLLVDYHKSVYGAYKLDVGGDFGADALVAGLSLMLEGELERGAEMKVESGHYWQGRRLALASYPAISQANIPTKEIYWLEGEWAYHATEPIREALHLATVVVANTVNTVVDAGEGAIHAVLSIAAGVMPGGSEIKSSWRTDLGVTGMKPAYFPPSGSSNYTYGVSGIFRFESTNTFDGVGTLVIAFSDAQVEGLDKADLRIYRLPDGTNRWQLVGGVVDTVSNIVSATIANLGTYAIAPPLPTGDLWLQPSTNGLPADGVSETTVVVTNLLLNTGVSATQEWLFAASAVGVEVLSSDADTNTPGVQIVSTNATLTLQLRAPAGGTHASVSLKSVAGDAYGQVGINLADNTPPATPTNVSVIAGQSRIWVSWRTNSEPDLAGYRVYYRAALSALRACPALKGHGF